MAKKALIAVAGVLLILVVVIVTRPANFKIERKLGMKASPQVAFEQVNDFHNWGGWSPWDKLDASMKRTYTGSPSGKGAVYEWVGNDKVGEGRMTITDSVPGAHVGILLEFIKPFAAKNQTDFNFTASGDGVEVAWLMSGERGFMEKAFSLVMDMDKMVGPDFESGLAGIKAKAEAEQEKRNAPPPAPPPPTEGAAPVAVDAGTP